MANVSVFTVILSVYTALMIFLLGWTVSNLEASPIIPYYDNDAGSLDIILFKDPAKGEVVAGLEAIVATLYLQWGMDPHVKAEVVLILSAVANLAACCLSYALGNDTFSGVFDPTIILILIPLVATIIIWKKLPRNDRPTLASYVQSKFAWNGKTTHEKIALLIYIQVIAITVADLIRYGRTLAISFDDRNDLAGAIQSVKEEVLFELLFQSVSLTALIMIGPAVFSFLLLAVSCSIAIIYKLSLLDDLETIGAPEALVTDFISELRGFYAHVGLLVLGAGLQSGATSARRAYQGLPQTMASVKHANSGMQESLLHS